MKFMNPLLAVKNMEKSLAFYQEVLGLEKILDFGANVTLSGGLVLQTADTWAGFVEKRPDELQWQGLVSELYFEEDDFDSFAARLSNLELRLVHPVKEHSWGQRVVRFYDPDGHIIEVGENMKTVCRRFLSSGLSPEQTARRMDVPLSYVLECCR